MHKNKLYSILSYFEKIEQNRLKKYLTSPYFNKNKILVSLYELLIKRINSQTGIELDKTKIWKQLFKETPYDDVRYRKLFSELLKLVEGFLAQQVYDENPIHQATYLIEAVGRKNMERLYNSTMKTARRLSKQQYFRPANFYFYQYQIERNFYEATQLELDRSSKTNIVEIINNLDYFFLAEKLKYYCSILSRQNILSHQYELLFIDEIIEHLNKHQYENIPPIAIYYQIYLTQSEKDNLQHYYKLKELLDKFGGEFPNNEAESIYTYAINYCISKINKGTQDFLKEFLLLNEDLLKKGILAEGALSPWRFQNIVIVALRLGDYKWTEDFINSYKSKLPEEFRENAVSFNSARLYFYQKKYNEVIALLQEVEYEDVSYNLNSKGLLLQSYYEMDEIEPLYSLLESFRAYLNRHKAIPLERRKNHLNFIRFIKKLSKIIPGDKANIEKLKNEVEATKGIASKKWLKEKIAELE